MRLLPPLESLVASAELYPPGAIDGWTLVVGTDHAAVDTAAAITVTIADRRQRPGGGEGMGAYSGSWLGTAFAGHARRRAARAGRPTARCDRRSISTNSRGMMKIAISVAASMPVTTTVPRIRREAAPEPSAIHSGTHPRMNANEVIRIGRSRSRAPSSAASHQVLLLRRAALCANSTDQNGVLGSQADQHDDADLGVDVEVVLASNRSEERAEYRDWHRQEHRERQRPALVERGKNQEDERDRQREERPGSAGFLFLIGKVRPVVADLASASSLCATCSSTSSACPGAVGAARGRRSSAPR